MSYSPVVVFNLYTATLPYGSPITLVLEEDTKRYAPSADTSTSSPNTSLVSNGDVIVCE